MTAGVRYRYKGHYVSRLDAARIGNLPRAKKFLVTEYIYKGKAESPRKGYRKPIEIAVKEALQQTRREAEIKRLVKARTYRQAAKERRERFLWQREQAKARQWASEAAELAMKADVSIEVALDSMEYNPEDWDSIGIDSLIEMAESYLEEGESFFDFEMSDLESEEKYK